MTTKSKVQLTTLSYVIAYVKDTAKATEFYRDVLGMKVKVDAPGWVELETGSTTLALHSIENAPSKPKEGMTDLVFAVDNVYETYDELKNAGVKFEKEPHQVCEEGDNVGMSVGFTDLDGNKLSIYSNVPKDKVRK
ncbi:MAG: VOC family protein [Candidatus Obscuribacterales bacterium]|nr:VOC family protein [Candidatus Obscuribacterales bacterium]